MEKKLILNESQFKDVMNYLQELPFKMSNALIVELDKTFREQNPEEIKEEIKEEVIKDAE